MTVLHGILSLSASTFDIAVVQVAPGLVDQVACRPAWSAASSGSRSAASMIDGRIAGHRAERAAGACFAARSSSSYAGATLKRVALERHREAAATAARSRQLAPGEREHVALASQSFAHERGTLIPR